MKWNSAVLAGMVLTAATALFFVGGCTGISTRADLHVLAVNKGGTFYSDLVNQVDPLKPFVPIDQVIVTFTNTPHDGSNPVTANAPFSEIVVDHYSVTFNNGVYSPIDGGMNIVVPSGGTVDAAITIDNPSEKAALLGTLTTTITSTAKIDFSGYVRTTGNWGDRVSATAFLTVQVDNFGDVLP